MLESGSSGSVRGVLSNEHPYREPTPFADLSRRASDGRFGSNWKNGGLCAMSAWQLIPEARR